VKAAFDGSVFRKVVLSVEQTIYTAGSQITSATRLVDDLGLSRFDFLKLAIYLEETFDLELPDETLRRFVTIGDIVKYLSRRYFRDIDFQELEAGAWPSSDLPTPTPAASPVPRPSRAVP
jgi:acyl carrier protein